MTFGDESLPALAPMARCRSAARSPSPTRTPWDASDAGRDPRHRLQHRRLYRPARHLGRRQAARSCATTRPGRPPKDDIRLNGGTRASALPLCLRGQGAARRRRRDQRLAALSRASQIDLQLDDPEAMLAEITGYLARGTRQPLRRRGAAWARTPAATMTTSPSPCRRTPAPPIANARLPAATERLGDAAQVWEAE